MGLGLEGKVTTRWRCRIRRIASFPAYQLPNPGGIRTGAPVPPGGHYQRSIKTAHCRRLWGCTSCAARYFSKCGKRPPLLNGLCFTTKTFTLSNFSRFTTLFPVVRVSKLSPHIFRRSQRTNRPWESVGRENTVLRIEETYDRRGTFEDGSRLHRDTERKDSFLSIRPPCNPAAPIL